MHYKTDDSNQPIPGQATQAKKRKAIPTLPPGADSIVRPSQAVIMTGRSLTSLWRDEKAGTMPKRRKIGQHAVGWLRSEIEEWLASRQTI